MHRKSMRAQHIHTVHVYKLSINRKRCLINIFTRRSEWNFNNYRHRLCVKFLSWIQLTFDILMWHVEQMSLRSVVPLVFVAACGCLWLFSDCFWSATEREKKAHTRKTSSTFRLLCVQIYCKHLSFSSFRAAIYWRK